MGRFLFGLLALIGLLTLVGLPTTAVAQNDPGVAPPQTPPHRLSSLRSGSYEVTSSLELPHIDNLNVYTKKSLCLVDHGGAAEHGFEVMSENNPLAHCPMVNVNESGSTLTFDIKCAGSNLAKASATYLLMGDSFRGRINMTMGGKNMTMTEVQEGHRLGDCRPPS